MNSHVRKLRDAVDSFRSRGVQEDASNIDTGLFLVNKWCHSVDVSSCFLFSYLERVLSEHLIAECAARLRSICGFCFRR